MGMCTVCRESVAGSVASRRAANKKGHRKERGYLEMEQNAYRLALSGPATYTQVWTTVGKQNPYNNSVHATSSHA